MDDIEKRAEPVDGMEFARQRRGEVEAKTVDVHLQYPIAQAVHDHAQDTRMGHVQGIAATGVIHVIAIPLVLRLRAAVIGGVVDAAKG